MRIGKSLPFQSCFAIFVIFFMLLGLAYAQQEDVNINTVEITAKRFEYSPNKISVKKGVPVVLKFKSLDVTHGFSLPAFGVRTDIFFGKTSTVSFIPDKTGTFAFFCDHFCGSGHEDMRGSIEVTE